MLLGQDLKNKLINTLFNNMSVFSLLVVVFINLVCSQSSENFQKDLLSYMSSSQLYLGNSICFA